MKKSISLLAAVALLTGPAVAGATITTWEIKGHVTTIVNGPDDPFGEFTVGDPYAFRWTFDTEAPLLFESPANTFRYDGANLSINIDIGPVSSEDIGPSPLSRIILRDNAAVGSDVVDGITFSHVSFDPNDGGFYTFTSHILRGPVLDIFNGPGLPTNPDARLADLPTAVLNVCRTRSSVAADCDLGFMEGSVDSVSGVPEPGSLALLGLGLAGLATLRRGRKPAA